MLDHGVYIKSLSVQIPIRGDLVRYCLDEARGKRTSSHCKTGEFSIQDDVDKELAGTVP